MFRTTWFSLKVAVLATAVVLVCAGDSWAQRRGGGGGWGGGRGWGGGGWGGRGWGGDYGGYGWGYPGGGYGNYSPGWYGAYYDNGPYYNSVPYYGDNAYVPSTSNATSGYQSFYPPNAGYGQTSDNTAMIQVRVPANAKLLFNGKETSQTGTQRFFTTPPLEAGNTYTYEVDATWQDANGQQVKRHREIQVKPNQPVTVNFMDQKQNSDQDQIRNPESNRLQNPDRDRLQKPKQDPDIR